MADSIVPPATVAAAPAAAAPAKGAAEGSSKKKGGVKYDLKTPKGTRDFAPPEMAIRQKVFETIVRTFKRHGAVTIDTPVFELKEILTGKYGEDSKLIYDLQDQGGELCSLRYDLTVPFARFLAMNKDIKLIKRYHISKVYRRDNPQIQRGRLREFFQCDFDIAGVYEPMVPDAEVLRIMYEALSQLEVGEFQIKVNHRKLLDGIFEVCGVQEENFRAVCSSIDKLDKEPWKAVREEIIKQKHIEEAVVDRIGEYVNRKGGRDLLQSLSEDATFMANQRAKEGVQELLLLEEYLSYLQVGHVVFDMSLARGLDYYTGVIYEAVLIGAEVGSVAGGGRYDNLVGMFGGNQIPCVGFSLGVERIFAIIEAKAKKNLTTIRTNDTSVLIGVIGEGFMKERMQIASKLWEAGIETEFTYKRKPKLSDLFAQCEKTGTPVALFFGEEELQNKVVKVKFMANKEDKGASVAVDDLVDYVNKILQRR